MVITKTSDFYYKFVLTLIVYGFLVGILYILQIFGIFQREWT